MLLLMSLPSITAVPDVGATNPVSMPMAVVLPAPLCPSSAVICPEYMVRLRPSTAVLMPVGVWNCLTKSRMSTHVFSATWRARLPGTASTWAPGGVSAPGGNGSRSAPSATTTGAHVSRTTGTLPRHALAQNDGCARKYQGLCVPNSDGQMWATYHARALIHTASMSIMLSASWNVML